MMVACAVNGVAVQHQAPASAKQFLNSIPRCAYTTILVRNLFQLGDWDIHVERLARSLRELEAATGMYAAYSSWRKAAPDLSENDIVRQLVQPTVLECLSALGSSGTADKAMLVVALPPAAQRADSGADARDLAVGPPLSVHAFAVAYSTPAEDGVQVALALGRPRAIPEAKDSAWVAERAPFERLMPPDAAEVVLCTANGELLEGLVTNLFVVAVRAEGGCEVLTAPTDGVVWGTMRQRVLQACGDLGVPVREQAPNLADRQTWKEAFLTNSVRLVQPIRRISCRQAGLTQWARSSWMVDFSEAPGPLAARLRAHILLGMQWHDMRALLK